jgi:hypothetical protein
VTDRGKSTIEVIANQQEMMEERKSASAPDNSNAAGAGETADPVFPVEQDDERIISPFPYSEDEDILLPEGYKPTKCASLVACCTRSISTGFVTGGIISRWLRKRILTFSLPLHHVQTMSSTDVVEKAITT